MPPPVTFNEKVRYKMVADRRPLLTTFADKYGVREYVAARVGAEVLTRLYLVTSTPRAALAEADLPLEFVVKPTHASGSFVIVAGFAPADRRLPDPGRHWASALVRPDRLDRDRLVEMCEDWVAYPYARDEWAYQNVPRRILVEELLEDGGAVPFDYRFFVFHGRVRMVQVEIDKYTAHTRTLYTPEWERLAVEWRVPAGRDVDPPHMLPEMIEVAETLGTETDFVRVDLYCLGSRIVFGELTNYPLAGKIEPRPPEFGRWLGDWWTLPKRYR